MNANGTFPNRCNPLLKCRGRDYVPARRQASPHALPDDSYKVPAPQRDCRELELSPP